MLILQVPPTPTPLPPPSDLPLQLPDSLFWGAAPDVVGVWNNSGFFFVLVQFLLLAILVVLFLGVLYRAIRQISK